MFLTGHMQNAYITWDLDRAMFESNFPPDSDAGSYGATWNAFKLIAAGCSEREKDALFSGTAARVYQIDLGV
jgi:L-fuconolactonase